MSCFKRLFKVHISLNMGLKIFLCKPELYYYYLLGPRTLSIPIIKVFVIVERESSFIFIFILFFCGTFGGMKGYSPLLDLQKWKKTIDSKTFVFEQSQARSTNYKVWLAKTSC